MEQLTVIQNQGAFGIDTFEHSQRIAKMLASSSLVPKDYQGRVDNCLIALEMSHRINASPLMVMQNLHIIQGKPSWSSPFIIANINACGRFKGELQFDKSGEGDEYGYEAWILSKDGNRIIGPKVTWKMVKSEGWLDKPGSKWKTMPELMFRYRSAAFFGRLYTPDILMGMQAQEEIVDVYGVDVTPKIDKEAARVEMFIKSAKTLEELEKIVGDVGPDQVELFNKRKAELE